VTPPRRKSLVIGKFLTILTITVLIILVAMLAMVMSLNLGSMYIATFSNISFELTPAVMGIVMLIFFVLAVMINALEMALCFLAKSFKEAQNYVTPLTFAVLFPAILLQGIAVEDAPSWLFMLPIINVLAVFQEVLLGSVNLEHMGMVVLSSSVYAVISSAIAIKTFEREDILFRS
jgi:sodium transport system permease protein